MSNYDTFSTEKILEIGINNLTEEQIEKYTKDIIDTLYFEQNNKKWSYVRSPMQYKAVKKTYPWGIKTCYEKTSSKIYQILQASRGFSFIGKGSLIDNATKMDKEADTLIKLPVVFNRIEELDKFFNGFSQFDNFVELGFRIPVLLKHFRSKNLNVHGYDIAILSILLSKHLGYNVNHQDFSEVEDDTMIDLKDNSLIVSYHMLEHVPDPYKAIKCIAKNMKEDSYFHVEVPIERTPNLRAGHLYQFNPGELGLMLKECKLTECLKKTTSTEERYLVKK